MKIGTYEPRVIKKGVEEAFIKGLKDGDVYYLVKLNRDGKMDVKEQIDAEILTRLVRIESILKNDKRRRSK